MDCTKMSVDEIRVELVRAGLTLEEANAIKGKANLVKSLTDLVGTGENLKVFAPVESSELNSEIQDQTFNPVEIDPDESDARWSDFVLSKFAADEMVEDPKTKNRLPNIDGLRRVTKLLIGEVLVSTPKVEKSPTEQDRSSTVSYTLILQRYDGKTVEFGGAADCSPDNTDATYAKHTVSVAETKAEARAFRKALGLKKIIAAEEASMEAPESWQEETINDMQLLLIDKKCKESDINVIKFMKSGKHVYKHYKQIPRNVASEMVRYINEYARDAVKIPDEIKGYNPEWRTE